MRQLTRRDLAEKRSAWCVWKRGEYWERRDWREEEDWSKFSLSNKSLEERKRERADFEALSISDAGHV